MNPSRRSREPPGGQPLPTAQSSSASKQSGGEKGRTTEAIWSSLGRLKRELRRMEHQLEDAGGESGSGAPQPVHIGSHPALAGTNPAETEGYHSGARRKVVPWTDCRVVATSDDDAAPPPLPGRFVDNAVPSSSSASSLSDVNSKSRRYQERTANAVALDDNPGGSGSSSSSTHRHPYHHQHQQQQQHRHRNGPGTSSSHYRDDSPKRVDFSRTNLLRELNWDGTYQDSLAHPPEVGNSDGSSNDDNLYPHHPLRRGGPLEEDTFTNSRDIRETDLHFLNFSRGVGVGGTSGLPSSSSSSTTAVAAAGSGGGGRLYNKHTDRLLVSSNQRSGERSGSGSNQSSKYPSPYAPPPSLAGDSPINDPLRLPSSGSSSSGGFSSADPSPFSQNHPAAVSSTSATYSSSNHQPSSSSLTSHHQNHHYNPPHRSEHQHHRQLTSEDLGWSKSPEEGRGASSTTGGGVPFASSSSSRAVYDEDNNKKKHQHRRKTGSGGGAGTAPPKLTKVEINTVASGGAGAGRSSAPALPLKSSSTIVAGVLPSSSSSAAAATATSTHVSSNSAASVSSRKPKDFLHVRKEVEEKWASSKGGKSSSNSHSSSSSSSKKSGEGIRNGGGSSSSSSWKDSRMMNHKGAAARAAGAGSKHGGDALGEEAGSSSSTAHAHLPNNHHHHPPSSSDQQHRYNNILGHNDLDAVGGSDNNTHDFAMRGIVSSTDRKDEFNSQLHHHPDYHHHHHHPHNHRPRPMKKSITAELKDSEIMIKLKERLKHQRSLASSQSGSNDTSIAESTSSGQGGGAPPALPPRQPLTSTGSTTTTASNNNNRPPALPAKTRKVAAAHPTPSYKGFSDSGKESSSKATGSGFSSSNSKKKSASSSSSGSGGGKKPFAIQLKKSESDGSSRPGSSRPPPPPPPDREPITTSKPRKPPSRIVAPSSSCSTTAEASRKPQKPGAKNIITTSSWRAGQELILRELGAASNSSTTTTKATSSSHKTSQQPPPPPTGNNDDNEDNDTPIIGRQPDGAEGPSSNTMAGNSASASRIGGGDSSGVPSSNRDNKYGDDDNDDNDDDGAKDVMMKSKNLYEDARNMLSELRMDPERPPAGSGAVRGSSSTSKSRPAVKRKAPKANPDTDKHQSSLEKQRHYDPDSVRKYMQRQKTERLKRQQQEREANQKAHQKKEQMMKELAIKQKKTAKVATPSGRSKTRLSSNNNNKENRPDALSMEHQDGDSTLTEDEDDDDDDDDDGTDDDLTPRPDQQQGETTISKGRKRSKEEEHHHAHQHKHRIATSATPAALSSLQQQQPSQNSHPTTSATNQQLPPPAKFIKFQGKNTNIDINAAVNDFAQVLQRHQGNGGRSQQPLQLQGSGNSLSPRPAYPLGAESAVSRGVAMNNAAVLQQQQQQHRTNQERKQALAATAMSLSNRIAQETKKLEAITDKKGPNGDRSQNSVKPHQADFVSRYDNIAGNLDDYAVFGGSDLPGVGTAHSASQARQEEAASRIQAAYRGHNVRQSLGWELPSGATFGQRMRGVPAGQEEGRGDGGPMEMDEDDASPLTDTSTFSEITATEVSEKHHHNHHHHHHHKKDRQAAEGMPTPSQAGNPIVNNTTTITTGSTNGLWSGEPQPDPYSVMSVMARQNQQYRLAGATDGDAKRSRSAALPPASSANEEHGQSSAFVASLDLTSLKQPVITSEERVVVGQTSSGQSVIARARYTRVEATVEEKGSPSEREEEGIDEDRYKEEEDDGVDNYNDDFDEDMSNEASSQPSASVTNNAHSHRPHSGASANRTSDEDSARPKAGGSAASTKAPRKKSATGPDSYMRQVSDTGQETDVSQLSDDEPRVTRSKLGTTEANARHASSGAAHTGNGGVEGGRLSPNSLANKMSATLNYYESVEESLRHLTGMERTRAVALAQQESVSMAQVLKARQQEHSADMRNLQLQAQQEAIEAQKQLEQTRKGRAYSAAALLEKEDNRRPDSRSNALTSLMSPSSGVTGSGVKDSPGNRRIHRSSATTSLASVTRRSEFTTASRTPRDRSSATTVSVKTAEDSRGGGHDSDSSIKTASDVDAIDSRRDNSNKPISEDIEESYSMSFDESITDEESFRQVLPSESHRKEVVRRQSSEGPLNRSEVSSHMTPYTDLSSLFVGEDSFNRFTADMVRQVMREEEYRAQHQAALLNLREKALREKAKAELAWLQQMKQQPRDKGADDHFPNLDKKEKIIRRNLQEQQAEIRRLKEANKMASEERQRLLQQHEEIAKIQDTTKETRQKLSGPPASSKANLVTGSKKGARTIQSEDEIEEASDISENLKDYKSDSEMYKDKMAAGGKSADKKADKLDKLRLDQKYMTARQQRLEERKKRAKELLEWKRRLDQEEANVFNMENAALQAWGGKEGGRRKQQHEINKESSANKRKQDQQGAKKATKPVPLSKKDDSAVVSDRLLSSLQDETAAKSRTEPGSISEAISTELSATGTLTKSAATDKKSRSASDRKSGAAAAGKDHKGGRRSPTASGSESSIPEEVPTGSGEKQKAHDSSDDTLINSSANDDYTDTFEPERSSSMAASRKKTSVGKLLPQGNSPLPSPWSRKTGSESESEDSISHTETMSDASDYEVRIRQLSDELRRRRKEVEILKKERSKRQKDKLKAQEEALKKQLDAYNNYIQQLKCDKDVLEHDAAASGKSAVRPQIKQPRGGQTKTSSSTSRHRTHSDDLASNSSSFEDMRDGTDSNQTSPSIDGKDIRLLVDEKGKKKAAVSLMDRISEGSESLSDKSSGSGGKGKFVSATNKRDAARQQASSKSKLDDVSEKTTSSSVQEAIDEESHLESLRSDKTASAAMLKIDTGNKSAVSDVDRTRKGSESWKDEEDASYSMDFSENLSTLAQSHNRGGKLSHAASSIHDSKGGRSEADISEQIEEASAASSIHSHSVSNQLKLDLMPKSGGGYSQGGSLMSPPTTGIQESDSETEYRINSASAKSEGSSRPSSEKSVGSMFSVEDVEDEEDDVISYSSDNKVSTKHSASAPKLLPPVSSATAVSRTDEDISEHLSGGSLPSISENKQRSSSMRQDSKDVLDSLFGFEEGEEDDEEEEDEKTPVPTPREMAMLDEDFAGKEEEDENVSLLMTDPLADFHLEDRVLVWGRRPGVLRFKGKVEFSPGIWAGVELDSEEGDSDGMHENKRYFTCRPGHGVMVHGSDISSLDDTDQAGDDKRHNAAGASGVAGRESVTDSRSLDESLTTDQEEDNLIDGSIDGIDSSALPAGDSSMLHSTPLSSPYSAKNGSAAAAGAGAASAAGYLQKPTSTPVKGDNDSVSNVSAMADSITDHLATSIVQDSVEAMGSIAARKSSSPSSSPLLSPKSPPATLPKPKKGSAAISPSSNDNVSASPGLINNDDRNLAATASDQSSSNMGDADRTTDGVMDSLLNEAISHMVSIKRRKAGLTGSRMDDSSDTSLEQINRKDVSRLSAPSKDDNLRSNNKSSSILDLFKSKEGDDDYSDDNDDDDNEKIKDNDSGLSLDPVQRPGSPLPGDGVVTVQDSKQLDEDMSNLFGEYIDDDLGFEASPSSAKPQPSFSGAQSAAMSPETSALAEEILPVVPHTKEQIAPIIKQAVDIFWQQRRYGEPLDAPMEPPRDFLEEEDDGAEDVAGGDSITSHSRKSWRRMLFDLTGEVIRDIYVDEDKPEAPVWQRVKHKTQKYFKGSMPPTTVDALRPLVEGAVFSVLDLNGTRRQNHTINKWNVRKKKDAVDAVLVQELGEEEKGWVDYNHDELNLKISLTDAIFDSLIADTARTFNGIYQQRSHSQI